MAGRDTIVNHYHYLLSLSIPTFLAAGLGEFKLRDLNDEINKLIREKRHWEDRIKELGGPDYRVGRADRDFKKIPCQPI